MGRGDAERKRNKENLVGTAFLRVSEEYQLIEDNGSSSPWVKRVISFFFSSVWQFHIKSVAVFIIAIFLFASGFNPPCAILDLQVEVTAG